MSSAAVLSSRITCCRRTVIAKTSSGRTRSGILVFREHRRTIRNRERLPEKDAAIAAFAVQRVERVEDADDERGDDEQHRSVAVRHGQGGRPIRRVERRQSRVFRRKYQADQKPNNPKASGRQRCDIERTVLPQFASHGPVQGSSRRHAAGAIPCASREASGTASDWVFIEPLLLPYRAPYRPHCPSRQ